MKVDISPNLPPSSSWTTAAPAGSGLEGGGSSVWMRSMRRIMVVPWGRRICQTDCFTTLGAVKRERLASDRSAAARCQNGGYDLLAAALPPLRPAAFFCCVVPPWLALLLLEEPDPDFLPPRLEDPSEFAIAAARPLLMPFLRRPSYCLSFLTLEPWSFAISNNCPKVAARSRRVGTE